jgi:hypothetical protein
VLAIETLPSTQACFHLAASTSDTYAVDPGFRANDLYKPFFKTLALYRSGQLILRAMSMTC